MLTVPGTSLLVFLLGATSSGLSNLGVSPYAGTLYAALVNFIGLGLFTYGMAPATGGHLSKSPIADCLDPNLLRLVDPTISMATFFAGLSTLPRSVLYIVAQTIGAVVGAYFLRLGLGDAYFPSVCGLF